MVLGNNQVKETLLHGATSVDGIAVCLANGTGCPNPAPIAQPVWVSGPMVDGGEIACPSGTHGSTWEVQQFGRCLDHVRSLQLMTEEIRSKSTGSARHTALSVPFFYYFLSKSYRLVFHMGFVYCFNHDKKTCTFKGRETMISTRPNRILVSDQLDQLLH